MTKKRAKGIARRTVPSQRQVNGKSFFVGIGVNTYKDKATWDSLNNAVKDVREVGEVLQSRFQIHDTYSLYDQEASRRNIISQFRELIGLLSEQDRLIIYYSGHGHFDKLTESGFWVPHEAENIADYISNQEILSYISNMRARHILLLSDACFSGSLLVPGKYKSRQETFERLDQYASRWGLCSGRHDEASYDGTPGENSPFAKALLEVFRTEKHTFSVRYLVGMVINITQAQYKDQLPIGNPISNASHKGGEYVFHLEDHDRKTPSAPTIESAPKSIKDLASFTDPRDQQVYRIVKIGGLYWMAENLRYAGVDSTVCDPEDPVLGRLYSLKSAKEAVPEGWRLPTDQDWRRLCEAVGGASLSLDADGTLAYNALHPSGHTGFDAQLGGYLSYDPPYSHDALGQQGRYWSSSIDHEQAQLAWTYVFDEELELVERRKYRVIAGLSVRCVQEP